MSSPEIPPIPPPSFPGPLSQSPSPQPLIEPPQALNDPSQSPNNPSPEMSSSQSNLNVNGNSPSSAPVSTHDWYALMGGFTYVGGAAYGPLPIQQLVQLAETGQISIFDYVKDGPDSPWITIHALQHYVLKIRSNPMAYPIVNSMQNVTMAPISPMSPMVPASETVIRRPPPVSAKTEVPAVVQPTSPIVTKPQPTSVPTAVPASVPTSDRPASGNETAPRPAFQPSPYRPPMPARTPQPVRPAKAPPKPHPVRSAPSFSFPSFDALSEHKTTLYAIGLIAVCVLVGVAMFQMPGRRGPLIALYKELTALHKEIEQKASSMSSTKELNAFAKPVLVESTKIRQELKNSTHPAKADLTEAVASMKAALGSRRKAEARAELNAAADKLNSAKKLLHL